MPHPLLADTPGATHLLLGNEAIARGALEAGVGCVTCYPGTPSSEVPDTLFRVSPEGNFHFEYSVNEKVALEVGGGAALGGVPTLVTMKHVGVNVAADPLMSLAYIGTPGGLVVLSADDPGCHSSQNEQDNRAYARLAGMPCFEPATAQEAKDMTREALLLSAKWQQPVLVRTTTRVNHLRGPVRFDPLPAAKRTGSFEKEPMRFVPIPAVARARHPHLVRQLDTIQKEVQTDAWTTVTGTGPIGIITSSICRAYVQDALYDMPQADQFSVLELKITYPLPEQLLLEFVQGREKVVVVEELEPFLETAVRELAQRHGLSLEVIGKGETLPRCGEFSTRIVANALAQTVQGQAPSEPACPTQSNLPNRPPNLCAGCSHRATYHAVRQVFGDEAIYSSDIGCYTLGILPPLRTADFLFCMGSSISGASGMATATGKDVVAFIGDSTFFHSGITGLVNAVYNDHNILVVVLDNRTTAMTGHQPHPGVDQTALGPNAHKVDIEQIVRGCGVSQVRKTKALNHKATREALQDFKTQRGVRVLIAEDPCALFAKRVLGKKTPQVAYVEENGPDVRHCAEQLACPAFTITGDTVDINADHCTGCMLCVQVCQGIKARKRSDNG